MHESYKKRIGYSGELTDISIKICNDYNLGKFKSNTLITCGYEDFNFILETNTGKYFIKIFMLLRTLNDCQRYIEVMEKGIKANVSMPKLYKSKHGHLHLITINGTKIRLCVMEYIDGKTFYDLREKLTPKEIKFIAHQATILNSINFKPAFTPDSWAITSFLKEYDKRGKYLKSEDTKLIKPFIKKFKDLKIESLPHCFVHGDIIATNLIRAKNGKLYIIDFAVANYYPRIQELAVISCNIILNNNSKIETEKNIKLLLKEYQKKIKLTKRELEIFPTYVEFAHIMHILRANYEQVVEKDTSDETKYWLNEGKTGLKQRFMLF